MKFLDKKEQVLDTQMTPYGEYLFSQGKFKPEYYSFLDDNILYQDQYGGGSEIQNNVEGRVQEETPQLESQTVFSDRNIFVRKSISPASLGIDQQIDNISDSFFDRRMYNPNSHLGTSDILKTDAPAWSVNMIRGEFSSTKKNITGTAQTSGGTDWYPTPLINIPQLNIDLDYKISVKSDIRFISDTELAIQYPNEEFLDVKPEFILAQILERNSEFTKENFEIEVFLVEEETAPGTNLTVEVLKPLKFRRQQSLVRNGILLDPGENIISSEPITPQNVEYYLNIKVDNQIDTELVCQSIENLKSRGFFIDTEIECKDVKNISLVDIYSTDAVSPECPDPNAEDPCNSIGTLY